MNGVSLHQWILSLRGENHESNKRNKGAEEAAFIREAMDQSVQPLFGLGFFGSLTLDPNPDIYGHLWQGRKAMGQHWETIIASWVSHLGRVPTPV